VMQDCYAQRIKKKKVSEQAGEFCSEVRFNTGLEFNCFGPRGNNVQRVICAKSFLLN
jgi:hypothetical protein